MKRLITLGIILFCSFSYAQNAPEEEAKKELEELYVKFSAKKSDYAKEKKKLEGKVAAYDYNIKEETLIARQLKKELDSMYVKQLVVKDKYLLQGTLKDSLDIYFPVQENYTLAEFYLESFAKPQEVAENEGEKEVYIMYGDGKIVGEEVFKGNDKVSEALKNVFSTKSETCLGSFIIPGDNQKIIVKPGSRFKDMRRNAEKEEKGSLDGQKELIFKEVKLSIREGAIYDMRAILLDEIHNQLYYFENKAPISLLNYTSKAADNFLFLSFITSVKTDKISDLKSKKGYAVRLSDVLIYLPNPGNNYVPDDVELTLPRKDGIVKDGSETKIREYKINQDSSLQNVMEMRTYTDFLGLFDDSPNGIVQAEGKADIFIAPFLLIKSAPTSIFKKVSPYVHYSRLDDETRGLTIIDTLGEYKLIRNLEVIQKSYLDMGFTLDVLGYAIKKDYPFNINLYAAARYQIATIERENEEDVNFKTIGTGIGLRLEFRRFNNFGFTFMPEFTYYNHLNRYKFFSNPSNFWIFRNEAEIYYYPRESKSQSIFLRLRTYLDRSDGEDSFFQLQFGYRFSLGLGNVKNKG